MTRPTPHEHRTLQAAASAVVFALAALSLGCGLLDNLAESIDGCDSAPVRLVNSQQTLDAVHLLGPDDAIAPENRITSGASRELWLCLNEGSSYSFTAVDDDGAILGTANCPASRSSYVGVDVRVVWTPVGLRCENW